jgi:hypothetical protein
MPLPCPPKIPLPWLTRLVVFISCHQRIDEIIGANNDEGVDRPVPNRQHGDFNLQVRIDRNWNTECDHWFIDDRGRCSPIGSWEGGVMDNRDILTAAFFLFEVQGLFLTGRPGAAAQDCPDRSTN